MTQMTKKTVFNLIEEVTPDPDKLEADKEKPLSTNNYIICITPRSGSSHLCAMLTSTHRMGHPDEYLSPELLPGILKRFPCNTLEEYVDVIRRARTSPNGVFGIKQSFFQLKPILEKTGLIQKMFGEDAKFIFLTRNNFILQGVSLYMAVETRLFHSVQRNRPEDMAKTRRTLEYDAEKIKSWINDILQMEFGFMRWFKRNGITPLRLEYEHIVCDPQGQVRKIVEFVGLEDELEYNRIQSRHEKIGDDRNSEWAERFIRDRPNYVLNWMEHRGLKPAW